ncbi:N-acyltransferase YncA [Pseudomonas knackmussii B13]|uniref:L-methionine sulfoximine/L-methionine sulfone acetyltransferase n=1 Tax=Pseudomonas knackmussii (strain DSM 6978 / CCUG 54928 / LMG 23759 / B13) TaxID=1301098 RepID=A0A024HPP5_PSEKB|nr:N-acyltransferase YncA [Pseudomonas knackmussii B13]
MLIREATPADLEALRDIYNDAVLNTTAIWNEIAIDVENRRAWLELRAQQGFPVLVCEDGGEVVGYSSYGPWRAFDGFRETVEHSVYVRADQRGKGLGVVLLQALVERARAQGLHVMVAAIESGNAASIRLHERLGFVTTGQMPQVGQKFGRWLDLTFMQLILDPRSAP